MEANIDLCNLLAQKLFGYDSLLIELGFPQQQATPLHANNTSAIQIVVNPTFHERMKHTEVDCHYIHEAYDDRIITVLHVNIDLQVADIFIKALLQIKHQFFVSKLM